VAWPQQLPTISGGQQTEHLSSHISNIETSENTYCPQSYLVKQLNDLQKENLKL